jgi:hypothetical protein
MLLKYFSGNPDFPLTDGNRSRREGLNPIVAGDFAYCEHYHHCQQIPCPDPRVNFMKHHDRGGLLDQEIIHNLVVQYRHPLHSLASYYQFVTKSLPKDGSDWQSFVDSNFHWWTGFIKRWVIRRPNSANVLCIRYEELVQSPDKTICEVLKHLGSHTVDSVLIRDVVEHQRVRLVQHNKLKGISRDWITVWEETNSTILIAARVPLIRNKKNDFLLNGSHASLD